LFDDFKAKGKKCKDETCDGEFLDGNWSTIYDQGFKVDLPNGIKFLANFRYNIKGKTNPLEFGSSKY